MIGRPEFPPGQCIVNLSSEDPGGFVDLGDRVLIDPRVYVSRQAVIDLGRLFGLPSPDAYQELLRNWHDLTEAMGTLQNDHRILKRDLEAAEWTLERKFAAKPQPKPGRPRKVTHGS